MSVKVEVRAQGHLKQFRADGQERFPLELPERATVRMAIDASGIPWDEVGVVAVNGAQVSEETVLAQDDQLLLLPPMEGG